MNGYFTDENFENKALMKVYDDIKHTEVSEEFILPDYLPDVKRIIRVDAKPKIDGKFITNGRIDYEGDVICHILFCDEANHLKNVTFTVAFSDGADINDIENECIANLIPSPESVVCKMLNPRRVSIRMRIDTALTVWCSKVFDVEIIGDAAKIQRAERNVDVMKLVCSGESGLNVSASLEADGALPAIGEIVSCNADVSFYECKGSDGKVLSRGDMSVTVFYSSNEGQEEEYSVLSRKIPIAQVILADGVDESYSCMARGMIDNVKVDVAENGFGERRIIELEVTYRIYLNCVSKSAVNLTEDIYAIGSKANCEKVRQTFCKFSKLYSTSFGATLALTKDEINMQNAESVFALSACPKISSVQLSEDKTRLAIHGTAFTSAVFKTDEGLKTYDYEVPLKLDLESSGVNGEFIYNCDIVCMGTKGRFDSENFYTELDIQLNLMILGVENSEIISKVEFSEKNEEADIPQMRFYYPSENETLWDIGKQFGVSVEELVEKNEILDGEIPRVIYIPYVK